MCVLICCFLEKCSACHHGVWQLGAKLTKNVKKEPFFLLIFIMLYFSMLIFETNQCDLTLYFNVRGVPICSF